MVPSEVPSEVPSKAPHPDAHTPRPSRLRLLTLLPGKRPPARAIGTLFPANIPRYAPATMQPPIIVSISRLHRQTSQVILEVEKSDRPVFVTQLAFVSAVLLPRPLYERLLRAAEAGPAEAAQGRGSGAPGEPIGRGTEAKGSPGSPLQSPLAVFGPLPPGTRFLTRQGISVNADLAAWLMDDGEEVRPILPQWADGEDDDGQHDGDGAGERIAWR